MAGKPFLKLIVIKLEGTVCEFKINIFEEQVQYSSLPPALLNALLRSSGTLLLALASCSLISGLFNKKSAFY
ncbi:hypothetical protein AQF98_17050 [Pedobacter sp. Hv1]|nr:hypothetical protein AQF98_17050 [Pedobacter sp. Hv1]